MVQFIFGLFCIVFGGTVAFMKKDQIWDLVLLGKRYQYEKQLYKLDRFILLIRGLSAVIGLLGIYICIVDGMRLIGL
ncbi:MAG: hypothetical protein E7231_07780 [Cellulosilyticum sp.]|nr:hypothetical protein [Cellulosilyticum sp.]